MTRIRKEPNRYWSKENKLKIVKEVLNGKSSYEIARNYDILNIGKPNAKTFLKRLNLLQITREELEDLLCKVK